MKKFLLLVCVLFSLKNFSQNQLNVGVNVGIPVGDSKDISNIAFGADINYLFDISEDFKVGPSIGFIYFSPEDDIIDAPTFIPVGASILFHSFEDKFYVGGEIGYGVAISDDNDGGVYIKPTVGYYITDSFKINAFYSGIRTSTEADTHAYAGIGLAYDLKASRGGRYAY